MTAWLRAAPGVPSIVNRWPHKTVVSGTVRLQLQSVCRRKRGKFRRHPVHPTGVQRLKFVWPPISGPRTSVGKKQKDEKPDVVPACCCGCCRHCYSGASRCDPPSEGPNRSRLSTSLVLTSSPKEGIPSSRSEVAAKKNRDYSRASVRGPLFFDILRLLFSLIVPTPKWSRKVTMDVFWMF